MNDKPKPLEHDQVKEIKAELLLMRDKLNDMITRLDAFSEERTVNKQFASREAETTREVSQPQGMFASQAFVSHCLYSYLPFTYFFPGFVLVS